jgi:hypothetical protein
MWVMAVVQADTLAVIPVAAEQVATQAEAAISRKHGILLLLTAAMVVATTALPTALARAVV